MSNAVRPNEGEGKHTPPPEAREKIEAATSNRLAPGIVDNAQGQGKTSASENPKAIGAGSSVILPSGNESDAKSPGGFRDSPEKQYNFFGASFNATSFGGDVRPEKSRTWPEELKEVDRRWLAGCGDGLDPIFDQACQIWTQSHILVLRYHPGERRRAEDLV